MNLGDSKYAKNVENKKAVTVFHFDGEEGL